MVGDLQTCIHFLILYHLPPLGSGDETHKGLSQPPNTQPSSLHNEPYNDKLETPFQLQVYNGNMETTSDSDKTFNPDALQMWSMAKQLGLTGEGSKESVIQKFSRSLILYLFIMLYRFHNPLYHNKQIEDEGP